VLDDKRQHREVPNTETMHQL